MNFKERKELKIRTPEGVEFSFLLASPVSRMLATLTDFLVKSLLANAIYGVCALLHLISTDLATAVFYINYFVIFFGYSIFLEWFWQGQTLGKKIFHLRVVDVQGLRLHFSQIVIRNILHIVDILPAFYMVGGIASILSPRAQRLGDMAANTIVIYLPKMIEPKLDFLLAGKYNSLRQFPHLCARLRQNVSPREAQIAMQALLRREQFEPIARITLLTDIAQYFKGKVTFPDEALEGVSDEQYVRNIVDILFKSERHQGLG